MLEVYCPVRGDGCDDRHVAERTWINERWPLTVAYLLTPSGRVQVSLGSRSFGQSTSVENQSMARFFEC